jgi:hypothetical protein
MITCLPTPAQLLVPLDLSVQQLPLNTESFDSITRLLAQLITKPAQLLLSYSSRLSVTFGPMHPFTLLLDLITFHRSTQANAELLLTHPFGFSEPFAESHTFRCYTTQSVPDTT